MNTSHRLSACLLLALWAVLPLAADVTLAPLFRDGAILQRDTPIPVWGRARPGERVIVRLGASEVATVADAEGAWRVDLPARPASGTSAILEVAGDSRIGVHDVLVGDVWLCGGQSNMMMPVRNARDAGREIAASGNPHLRLFKVATQFAERPAATVDGIWHEASPASTGEFSATAYYFGRKIQKELGIPVGLIVSAYGNTPISTWRGPGALAGDNVVAEWWRRKQDKTPPPRPHRRPSVGHNGMIAPLTPYAVRGFLWYQGEADATETPLLTPHYAIQFAGLIREWRALFGGGRALPFYWVQLAGYGKAAPRDWTGLREQQTQTLAVPGTGQAVALDLGDAADIHPKDKQQVGARLARLALRRAYGREIVDAGPVPIRAGRSADRVAVHFSDGPLSAGGDLAAAFELAGGDGVFHPADHAVVEGSTVILASSGVRSPVTVRFAWQDLPPGFLYNPDGLPAAPFAMPLASR